MLHRPQCARVIRASSILCVLTTSLCCGDRTFAYTPSHPEVHRMVERGLKFLDQKTHRELGGKCLVGMVYHNEKKKGNIDGHPQIDAAVEACLKTVDESYSIGFDYPQHEIYNTGIALLFLCDLDPQKYRPEIEHFVRALETWQRPYGAWGYPLKGLRGTTGDTSMTQYGVLGLWAAHRIAGVNVSLDTATKACGWLIRTQDPSGAWGYQGKDPGTGRGTRVKQQDVRHSMAAAGLSSIYVLADFLHLVSSSERRTDGDQPVSVKSVDEVRVQAPLTNRVNTNTLRNAMRAGDDWFKGNLKYEGTRFTHYYMYALERYFSFYARVTSIKEQANPRWYDDGVRFLADTQREDNSWNSDGATGPVVDTAYAILFLQRSTRELVGREDKGVLTAGRGLPKIVNNLRIQNNRLVADEEPGPAEAIIRRLEEDGAQDVDWVSVDQYANMKLSDNKTERAAQIESLQRVLRVGTGAARLIAVRILAKTRDLNQVPTLIYALSVQDQMVSQEARNGLRFVSRKFQGFRLPDDPEPAQIQSAISDWKRWYRSIQPAAEFWE